MRKRAFKPCPESGLGSSIPARFMTHLSGHVIATGTTPGVGCFREPQRWLVPGDIVVCEIGGIGTLVMTVVDGTQR